MQETSAFKTSGVGDDRHFIIDALDETLVVEAAAGTGKTTELVKRIVRLIETGRATVEQIVAVTFSEKAAGELKLRLREELERARGSAATASAERATPRDLEGTPSGVPMSPESQRLERAVQRFEEAHVSTIHGFCADLLRERPVEARIDPSFQVLTEGQATRLFAEAFTDWIQSALDDPPEGVRRSLRRETVRRFGQDEDEGGPIERLKRAGHELLDWRDHPTPWVRPEGFDRESQIDHLLDAIASFSELSRSPTNRSDLLFKKTQEIRRLHAEVHQLRMRDLTDYDGWEAKLCALARMAYELRDGRSTVGQYSKTVPRLTVVQARDLVVQALIEFRDRADADLAALVHGELQEAVARYEDRKLRAGVVDFLDLLIRARDLVRDRADVRRDFQRRFRYLLVDEFQDTDPLQAELLLLLTADEPTSAIDDAYGGPGLPPSREALRRTAVALAEAGQPRPNRVRPGALFLVGDPKQSIYRFRRADVGIYRDICERLVADGARRVRLRTSFRSVPSIQRAVNAAFSRHMTGDAETLQAEYVELQPHREDTSGQPAIVALPVPRPYGYRGVTATAITASMPEAVGEFVRWLVQDSGWTLPMDDGTARPVRGGDVCLLFRRFLDYQDDVTRAYVEALESRGLTHLLVGGKAFHEREEVDALRTALTAIEWPDDGLSVFATLRGPFFAVGEEELLAWHALGHGFRPFSVPATVPETLQPVSEALAVLAELSRLRNHRPIADTIGRLMEATRAHAGFVLWRGGEQVLANVLQIAELSRQYEAEGGLSFRGFVDQLREAASRAPTPEAPILEEGTDGVRLMTVHKAKGLEFPIVILADIGCRLSRDDAQRFLDSKNGLAAIKLAGWTPLDLRTNNALEASRDKAEGVRLAYVAATRARDLLVIPAIGDGPHDRGWVHPLSPAIYPSAGGRGAADPPDRTEGRGFSLGLNLPEFKGKDTVLDRPDGQSPTFETVSPGAYAFLDPITDQPYTVVWWDPLLLDRPGEERRGLRREDLITKDASPDLVAEDRARYERWRDWKTSALARGAEPSTRVMTVSEWIDAADTSAFAEIARGVEIADARKAREPSREREPTPEHEQTSERPPERSPEPSSEPSGRRYGILVHALLAASPLTASREEIETLAYVHARLLNATDEERVAAIAAAERALAHPLLSRARAAEAAGRSCRREVALSLAAHDGGKDNVGSRQSAVGPPPLAPDPGELRRGLAVAALRAAKADSRESVMIDGQADLVFDEGDRWVVVDFKTDVEMAGAEDTYRTQVGVYVEAIRRATGRPAAGVLLRV